MATRTNTSGSQDKVIADAESGRLLSDLLDIIDDFDTQISAWKDASGCSDPDTLSSLVSEQRDRIKELEKELAEARSGDGWNERS